MTRAVNWIVAYPARSTCVWLSLALVAGRFDAWLP